ncbi:MAG: hypothetical protein B7Y99_00410 [Caulobacterales bacterium 32-69-10]|nr:MAG: hypothetical protein B7Y99_00410 [Caulobacterales bacterium 32-69-10]
MFNRSAPLALAFVLIAAAGVQAVAATPPVARRLSFVKVVVKDLSAMEAFYGKAFGMQVKKRLDYPNREQTVLGGGGLDLVLVRFKQDTPTAAPQEMLGFYLKDVAGAYQQAIDAGAKPSQPPRPGAPVAVARVQDPEGREIELLDSE